MQTTESINADYDPQRITEMEAIVSEHETSLLRYAARIVNNPTAAQDVVQNVFVKLFRTWKPGQKPSAKMKGWLYRVTHNEAVDLIRRESRLKNLHEKQAEEQDVVCEDGHNCPAADKKAVVLNLINKLKSHEQQVLLLRLDHGLSYREISDITGRSEGNVGNILHHAVKQLNELIKRNAGELI